MIRAVFFGTPGAAVPSLRTLANLAKLLGVVTRPDRPKGRGRHPQPSPVKQTALELALPVVQPSGPAELHHFLEGVGEIDVGVLVAFGMILPREVLSVPRQGILNVHFSLLPRWRGPAPVERALLAGDTVTGVTLIRLDEGIDTGPIVAARSFPIGRDDTAGQLRDRLAESGALLLADTLPDYVEGGLRPQAQDPTGATYAKRIDPDEVRLDLQEPADMIERRVRAFDPRPGAHVLRDGDRFKLWTVRRSRRGDLSPGQLKQQDDLLFVGTGDGTLDLLEVQPAGGRRMKGIDWARGQQESLGILT